jgi:hypothetical protein
LQMLHKHQLFRLILFIKKTINEIVFFLLQSWKWHACFLLTNLPLEN